MGEFTKGPWVRDRTSGLACDVRSASGRKVALCWGLSATKAAIENRPAYKAECDANAVLIAASPTLLEALEGMLRVYEELHAKYDLGDCEETIAARKAIAAAKGAPRE